MTIYDQRMMEVAQTLKTSGRVKSMKAFFEGIGFERRNAFNIRNGTQSFKSEHIMRACTVFGVNANRIFGAEEKMFMPLTPGNLPVNLSEKKPQKVIKKKHKILTAKRVKKAKKRVTHS